MERQKHNPKEVRASKKGLPLKTELELENRFGGLQIDDISLGDEIETSKQAEGVKDIIRQHDNNSQKGVSREESLGFVSLMICFNLRRCVPECY